MGFYGRSTDQGFTGRQRYCRAVQRFPAPGGQYEPRYDAPAVGPGDEGGHRHSQAYPRHRRGHGASRRAGEETRQNGRHDDGRSAHRGQYACSQPACGRIPRSAGTQIQSHSNY